jgi:hypothetical protein
MDCTTTAQAQRAHARLREVALDTSALSNLCSTGPDPAEALIEAVTAIPARLVLLPEMLVESFVGRVEFSRHRARVLAAAEARLPARCGIAIPLERLWRHEANGEVLSGTPVLEHARIAGLVRDTGVYDRLHDRHADKMKESVRAMHGRAGSLERQAEAWFLADTTAEQRREREELLADFGAERLLCRGPLSRLINGTRQDAADLLSDPARVQQHRAHVLASGLAAANGLRVLLHSHQTPEAEWLRRDHGNWTDARIAANAAYCDYLVTDDEGLYACLEFLGAVGFVGPRPIRLEPFLAGAIHDVR